jgi:hypothetical protein
MQILVKTTYEIKIDTIDGTVSLNFYQNDYFITVLPDFSTFFQIFIIILLIYGAQPFLIILNLIIAENVVMYRILVRILGSIKFTYS